MRCRKPPSQTWRTFLENYVQQLVAIDFLVVRTMSFRLLFVFVAMSHQRRHALHFNVTSHPTAEWTARQIAEAFPWDSTPRYLLPDRDSIYGAAFPSASQEHGNHGSADGTAIAMAERLCGALHRLAAS